MDVRRIEKSADKIVDAFADMRVTDEELMYVAMYVVMRSQPRQILDRVLEFGEQLKWEINNERRNTGYVQEQLFQ
jgi:N-acetyl-gamma-glutamylphosphate reductase